MAKQLLFLSNHGLSARLWEKGKLGPQKTFYNDESGWHDFSDHLGATKNIANYLLVDLIEEDFQRDNLPHVTGEAHRALVARRLSSMYRDTPFRTATRQGRNKDGRRDDRILFCALTNVELLTPWVEAIEKYKAPLAGIYSLALLSLLCTGKMHLKSGPVLLVSQQTSGLRQSFFVDGNLFFSRLTPRDTSSNSGIADVVLEETAKTRKFLSGNRQLARDSLLEIVIISSESDLPQLRQTCLDGPGVSYRAIGMEEAGNLLHVKNVAEQTFCDELFLEFLAAKAPASHYEAHQQVRHYQLWKARAGLYAVAAFAAAASVLWTGANSITAWERYQKTSQLRDDAGLIEQKYKSLVGGMSPTKVNPHNMKAAVDMQEAMHLNAPTPEPIFGLLSKGLESVRNVSVNSMQWESLDAAVAPGAALPNAGGEAPTSAVLLGIPRKPTQQLVVDGEINAFDGDFRAALDSLLQLKLALEKNHGMTLEVLKSPLDIKSSAPLYAKIGGPREAPKAEFRVKIMWTP